MGNPTTVPFAAFSNFADKIGAISPSGSTEADLQSFLLEDGAKLRIYYAPFDWINTNAKIIIVGITPGKDSMLNAFRASAAALRQGQEIDECSRLGKQAGSFSNARSTISRMFDELDIPKALGIDRSEELFGTRYDLLHPTSCIRYPVFVWRNKESRWTNYTGHSPKLLKWKTSLHYIENVLAEELSLIPRAIVVPCGEAVDGALRHLSEKRLLDISRCLQGFPHPSGANGHRLKYFNERKGRLKEVVHTWSRRWHDVAKV